jgi:hypothetical protein
MATPHINEHQAGEHVAGILAGGTGAARSPNLDLFAELPPLRTDPGAGAPPPPAAESAPRRARAKRGSIKQPAQEPAAAAPPQVGEKTQPVAQPAVPASEPLEEVRLELEPTTV